MLQLFIAYSVRRERSCSIDLPLWCSVLRDQTDCPANPYHPHSIWTYPVSCIGMGFRCLLSEEPSRTLWSIQYHWHISCDTWSHLSHHVAKKYLSLDQMCHLHKHRTRPCFSQRDHILANSQVKKVRPMNRELDTGKPYHSMVHRLDMWIWSWTDHDVLLAESTLHHTRSFHICDLIHRLHSRVRFPFFLFFNLFKNIF